MQMPQIKDQSKQSPVFHLPELFRQSGGSRTAIALGWYLIGYLLMQVLVGGSTDTWVLITDAALLPIIGAVVWVAWRTARENRLSTSLRRAWTLIGTAHLFWLAGDLLWLRQWFPGSTALFFERVDLIYLIYYPLMLAGALLLPQARRSRLASLRLGLDASAVLVAGGLAVWYLLLGPGLGGTESTGSQFAVSVLLPVGDLLLLFVLAVIWTRESSGSSAVAARLLGGGIFLSVLADLLYGYGRLHEAVDTGVLQAVFWAAGLYMVLLAGSVEYRSGRSSALKTATPPSLHDDRPVGLVDRVLPYGSVIAAYTLLALVGLQVGSSHFLAVTVVATLVITGLVILRQIVTLEESSQLLKARTSWAEELQLSESRFRSLVHNSSDVIMLVDEVGDIRYVSDSIQRIFGHEPTQVVGDRLESLVDQAECALQLSLLQEAMGRPGETGVLSWRWRHRDGSWRHAETTFTNRLDDPDLRGLVLNTRDVTDRTELELQMEHMAFHDLLTDLPNRSLFQVWVEEALETARARRGTVGILFIDMDGFKRVNDALGHAAGDRLLEELARRLQRAAGDVGAVSRFAGDEFTILLRQTNHIAAAVLAERLVDVIAEPIALAERMITVSPSIGIAMNDTGDETAAELLRNADLAMYQSKREGRNRFTRYVPEMHQLLLQQMELEADLRRALERQEFVLHFQPTVTLLDGEITGVEALIRWQHPTRGLLPPARFIPQAEETLLIVPMGRWVLRQACRQVRYWQEEFPERALNLSVNLSSRELQQPDLVQAVAEILKETGLPPHTLVLEITESALIRDADGVASQLAALKSLGIQVAMDDFGTGYSSLSYLRRLPIDIVKIDRSFVERLGRGIRDDALVEIIIALGAALNLQTIAEGIEMASQVPDLARMGCRMGQGYHFARPAEAAVVEELLRLNRVGDDARPPQV